MPELTEFKYVNNSLTTIPQSRVLQKIASHFHIPLADVRESLNKDKLANGILSFSDPVPMKEELYVASFALKIDSLITGSKIEQSRFYSEYSILNSQPAYRGVMFMAYPSMMILTSLSALVTNSSGGKGGIYMCYPKLGLHNEILLFFSEYLRLIHPPPPPLN